MRIFTDILHNRMIMQFLLLLQQKFVLFIFFASHLMALNNIHYMTLLWIYSQAFEFETGHKENISKNKLLFSVEGTDLLFNLQLQPHLPLISSIFISFTYS